MAWRNVFFPELEVRALGLEFVKLVRQKRQRINTSSSGHGIPHQESDTTSGPVVEQSVASQPAKIFYSRVCGPALGCAIAAIVPLVARK